mmetsp:Transcript_19831/g.24290  ORF Transcript_19831/g.24290 Transcript_19831/m.24290 type:complete len:122 (-) Transcript_19831:367-732(-)
MLAACSNSNATLPELLTLRSNLKLNRNAALSAFLPLRSDANLNTNAAYIEWMLVAYPHHYTRANGSISEKFMTSFGFKSVRLNQHFKGVVAYVFINFNTKLFAIHRFSSDFPNIYWINTTL